MKGNIENRIVNTCIKRYGNNLAAVLIFGSYNTGKFVKGISDINLIILFKKKNSIKFQSEYDILYHNLFADIPVSITHFRIIEDYRRHIYGEGSWSSWITVINGSKAIYSTKEFELFRQKLLEKPILGAHLLSYLLHKDEIELKGYFKRIREWDLTKAIFFYIRRKLQVINYLNGNNLEFDYQKSLRNIKHIEHEKELSRLSDLYYGRKNLTNKKINSYYEIAHKLTYLIKRKIKNM